MSDRGLPTIGFVGLGHMGGPMSRRLIEAGYRVRAFDVSADARAVAVAAGALDAPDLASVASDADVVILMLPNSQIVESVLGDNGFSGAIGARARASGVVVVDMSSSEPLRTRLLAERLAKMGVSLVDAPVSGGVAGAVAGTLTVMVGGSDDVVEHVRPVLEHLGNPVHAGPVGAGHAVKALNNLLSATHLLVTSEAMIVGQRFGLDPNVMLSIFNASSGRSGSTQNKWPNFVLTKTYDSGFGLRLMLKDMRIAVQLSEQTGAPSELGADAVELWSRAADALPESADHTEIARWLKDRSGGHE
jgi:3-hydroxyisobutyrate dehydrogenase